MLMLNYENVNTFYLEILSFNINFIHIASRQRSYPVNKISHATVKPCWIGQGTWIRKTEQWKFLKKRTNFAECSTRFIFLE